jgi:glycosyltransferase involved in cell wall biosynthesis
MELKLSKSTPTLCLNMIVKNESKIITRLFDSVLSIIDCYCICDTGSTDNTIELIENYFKEKNIPGKIVLKPFKDFCYNRNYALTVCNGMSDYVLLLDADMVIEVNGFNKSMLELADSFTILQGNEQFFYQNMRIVKNNGLYLYSGVTHEYVNTPHHNITYAFDKKDIFINDIGDGGAKSDKFERDIRLLTEGIQSEPNNVRYVFYLAQSLKDIGKIKESIKMYKKRISMGGWYEEIWYSYYMIGKCWLILNDENKFECWMNRAYKYRKERAEPIYELTKYFREIGQQIKAYHYYILDLLMTYLFLQR